ncbi:MAG TPA: DUF1674 domain-containing protein [Stellaceae bacterium]|nr:DUF1674 domain-containing protein [Stellaceae bacterium]
MHDPSSKASPKKDTQRAPAPMPAPPPEPAPSGEIGGPKGPEPTRYGDWQYNGRCTDF